MYVSEVLKSVAHIRHRNGKKLDKKLLFKKANLPLLMLTLYRPERIILYINIHSAVCDRYTGHQISLSSTQKYQELYLFLFFQWGGDRL